ncbi:MAG: hypothetical protein FWD71_04190 [Oscillospiraceae bacterium]|nr:hypothetical protein [Oscillospiraceae bacterium]
MEHEYTKEIFDRADIKQLRKFLLESGGTDNDCYGTYQERLDRNSEDIMYALIRLSKTSREENQPQAATDDLTAALLTYRDVFTEIGMKVGARLMFQLMYQNN